MEKDEWVLVAVEAVVPKDVAYKDSPTFSGNEDKRERFKVFVVVFTKLENNDDEKLDGTEDMLFLRCVLWIPNVEEDPGPLTGSGDERDECSGGIKPANRDDKSAKLLPDMIMVLLLLFVEA